MQWSRWEGDHQCVVWEQDNGSFISWVWNEDRVVFKKREFKAEEDINTIFAEMFGYD